MADDLLHPVRPTLIAIGGLSGSGKSTLSFGLAPRVGAVPGAVVLRSDEIRKQLSGIAPLERLGPAGYTAEVSARVYRALNEVARVLINAGHTVIVDAVFASPEDRHTIQRLADDAWIPFVGLWLDAPEAMLIARASARRGDPSDADAEVIKTQVDRDLGSIDWCRLDASVPAEQVLEAARQHLGVELHDQV